MEDNPPPEKDKKLNERLIDLTEPSDDDVKKQLHEYDLSIQEVKKYIEIFKNIYLVHQSKIKDDVVNELCDNVLNKIIERFDTEYYINNELNDDNINNVNVNTDYLNTLNEKS